MSAHRIRTMCFCAAGALLLGLSAAPAMAAGFSTINLVSDGFVPAKTTDPDLVNPWGVSYGPTSPFWISDNGTGVSTLYTGNGTKIPLTVPIAPGPGISNPTGQVFNSTSDFQIAPGKSAVFIFDGEDGRISGWNPTVSASSVITVDNSAGPNSAVYKGLAIGVDGGQNALYATNFRAGDVEVYNGSFSEIGTFTDPTVAPGYAPFNIQALDGHLFVTFALQDAAKHDDMAGAGFGYVDEFNMDGSFDRRIASVGGPLNSPWGLAIAPSSWGSVGGDLLVGNFGDGTIDAFNLSTLSFDGELQGHNGAPLKIDGLWALIPGNGGAAGSPGNIYFTAGLNSENDGLFGAIAVPEPSAWALSILGLGLAGAALRRNRARVVAA